MKLEGIRNKVFLDRYSRKDAKGNPLEQTPEEMWRRVAKGIAGVEKKAKRKEWEGKFYALMEDFKFLPGGRILAGAGTGFDVTYFNCFVIPNPPDSRGGIMENLTQMIEIMAHGGGVGLNLSSLRPRGSRVKKVNGFSSGPMNWAELYSLATKDIVQQGGSRRGALMLMLHDWHPDIEEFITIKQDLTKINGANLSVCVSDDFMEAVKADKEWDLLYPDLDDPKYDTKWNGDVHDWIALGGKVKIHKTIKASFLWNLICEAAWRSAEPGLHFLQRSNKRSNTWYFEKLLATNPCGEQPLGAWGVCNLGAMNLSAYVNSGEFDYKSFGKDVRTAIRFLDNVIDDTHYFFKENEKVSKDIRRVGLGIMGIADMFIKMKIRYGSEDSVKVSNKIFETLRNNSYTASSDIAKEKGTFPKYDKEKYLQGYHVQALPGAIRERIEKQGIRNAVLQTIAPTGSTSLVAGVSSGIEPIYEFEYTHNGRLGKQAVYHSLYGEWKKAHPGETRPDYFVGANDLAPEDHVKIQAVAQEYIDASISKTVNAPNAHTIEDVKRLYMLAYDMGLKGITYMRDGSRQGVLERIEEKKVDAPASAAGLSAIALAKVEALAKEAPAVPVTPRVPRPVMLTGVTYKTDSPSGKMYITINQNEKEDPFEVFINIGKSGSDLMALADALGRMISFVLRIHSPVLARERVREIVSELTGIGGARSIGFGENRVRSLPDAIAKVLAKHCNFRVNGKVEDKDLSTLKNGHSNGHLINGKLEAKQDDEPSLNQLPLPDTGVTISAGSSNTSLFDICPECGSGTLAYEEGCKKCYGCGYSEC